MINSGSGIRTPHSLNTNPNRLAASPQEEAQIGGGMPERSALPLPNRAAHERLKSQQLQRILNEKSGTDSALRVAPYNQRVQVVKNNEQCEDASTSDSKKDSQAKPSGSGIWGMARALSDLLPWNWERLYLRKELQSNLAKIKEHFETLKAENWSPDSREFYCDEALLPIAVKAENARNPR